MIIECNGAVEYDSAKNDGGVKLVQRKDPDTVTIDFEVPGKP
jgi:hypothetical protein